MHGAASARRRDAARPERGRSKPGRSPKRGVAPLYTPETPVVSGVKLSQTSCAKSWSDVHGIVGAGAAPVVAALVSITVVKVEENDCSPGESGSWSRKFPDRSVRRQLARTM